MDLIIDTTKDKTDIILGKDKISFPARDANGDQRIVAEIDKIFRCSDVSPNQVNSIIVNPGPGPFTGVRIGVSVANVLASVWNKPIKYINGGKIKLAIPSYGKKNIIIKRPPL